MTKVQFFTLTFTLCGLMAGATGPAAACSSPYQEGKRYSIGDWVSAPSSIIAATDNRISCSPPGVDGCPASGYNIVETAAHQARYNYQCNSLDTLCSDKKYAPGTIFSGMAWSVVGNDPCSVSTYCCLLLFVTTLSSDLMTRIMITNQP
jgi:hypothetical protein